MAILWDKLERILKSYFERGKNDNNRTYSQTAEFIQTQYLLEIKTNAMDPFGNRIVKLGSETGLKASLLKSFGDSFRSKSPSPLNSSGLVGAKLHWISAQMSTLIPAPPMTIGITNIVDNAGQISPMSIKNDNNIDILSREIIKALKQHSTTIGGTYTGMNTIPTPPVPIVIKWVGIQ